MLFSLFLSCMLSLSSAPAQGAVSVLCYHSFVGDSNVYSFSREELENHIEYFIQKGFSFITLDDFRKGNVKGRANILVTIDDGNRSVFSAYMKVFRNHNIKPVLAIYPAVVGRDKRFLSWRQLKRLAGEGCGIAVHGYWHRYLTDKLYKKDRKAFYMETVRSKEILEEKLETAIDTFIYPGGVYSDTAKRELAKAGYKYAFTIDWGVIPLKGEAEKNYGLPRFMLTRKTFSPIFQHIVLKGKSLLPIAEKKASADREKKTARLREKSAPKLKSAFRKKTVKKKRTALSSPVNVPVPSKKRVKKKEAVTISGNGLDKWTKREGEKPASSPGKEPVDIDLSYDDSIVFHSASAVEIPSSNKKYFFPLPRDKTGDKKPGVISPDEAPFEAVHPVKKEYFKVSRNAASVYHRWIAIIRKKLLQYSR